MQIVRQLGTSVLSIFLAATPSVGSQARPGLPDEVRSALDRMHPGWRIAAVGREVRTAIGARLGPTPNVIAGDFDGNRRPDVAVLIEFGNVDDTGKPFTHYSQVIAFLTTDSGFHAIALRDRRPGPDGRRFLTLQKRDTQGFDFEANRKYLYRHDAIGEWYFGIAGGSYIHENGHFRYVVGAD